MIAVAAAILAAGESRRLGRPKQLLGLGDSTLLGAIAARVCASTAAHVCAVLGAHAGAIRSTIEELPLAIVPNVLWPEGIASSIRCAVAWALRMRADALLVLACDQPQLTTEHVDALIARFAQVRRPVASHYGATLGVPAIFGRAELPALAGLVGDVGARRVLDDAHAEAIDWPSGAYDIDTPRDVVAMAAALP